MKDNHSIALLLIGGAILFLVAAAIVLLSGGAKDQEIARRISSLREGGAVTQQRSSRFVPLLLSVMRRMGIAMRDRIMSARDSETLGKSLAAAGLEPSKAMPVFVIAKLACLLVVPALIYLGSGLFGFASGKQALYTALSVVLAMMLPNWSIAVIRRSYQQALRRGIPDALDLLVVCAEAGLGLESAVERVANEMKQSNRPVGIEFSMLSHELRVYPDRRVALVNLAMRTGLPALKRLAGTIAQTLKYGTPLGQGLRTLAAEMRNERITQFEERAGRLPALLVMPMILFILPCLFIVVLGQPISQLIAVFAAAR